MSNWELLAAFFLKLSMFLLASFALPASSSAQNIEALDVQNGFFDLQLGGDLADFRNIEKKGTFLKKERYVWKGSPKNYAGVRLASVELFFFKNRLHSIAIYIKGDADSNAFLDVLTMYYGPGEQLGMAPHFTWSGNNVKLIYEKHLFTKNTTVVFESVEVQRIYSQEYRVN